jgi:BolA protein
MRVEAVIEQKLTEALRPSRLAIEDESARHAGHAGHHPHGGSHLRIEIVSPEFTGKSRIDRHRMVNTLLAEELAGRVHALALTLMTPEEDAARR